MGHVEYYPPVVGAVWIVAGNTVGIRHRVIHVRPGKSELFSLMTLSAEGRHIPFQQKFCFG
jgi:hypothetical protein